MSDELTDEAMSDVDEAIERLREVRVAATAWRDHSSMVRTEDLWVVLAELERLRAENETWKDLRAIAADLAAEDPWEWVGHDPLQGDLYDCKICAASLTTSTNPEDTASHASHCDPCVWRRAVEATA